jgi:hypothetical protein
MRKEAMGRRVLATYSVSFVRCKAELGSYN